MRDGPTTPPLPGETRMDGILRHMKSSNYKIDNLPEGMISICFHEGHIVGNLVSKLDEWAAFHEHKLFNMCDELAQETVDFILFLPVEKMPTNEWEAKELTENVFSGFNQEFAAYLNQNGWYLAREEVDGL
jgi:hypothetical protein